MHNLHSVVVKTFVSAGRCWHHCLHNQNHVIREDKKKPQEHVLKRKTREDGRYWCAKRFWREMYDEWHTQLHTSVESARTHVLGIHGVPWTMWCCESLRRFCMWDKYIHSVMMLAGRSFKTSLMQLRKIRKKNPRKKNPNQSLACIVRVAGCRGPKKRKNSR